MPVLNNGYSRQDLFCSATSVSILVQLDSILPCALSLVCNLTHHEYIMIYPILYPPSDGSIAGYIVRGDHSTRPQG